MVHPPYDWQFLQPEAGQTKPFKGSFTFVCDEMERLRKANSWLAKKHNWAMDREGIENDVEAYNVQRCVAHGWLSFIADADGSEPPNWSGQRHPAPLAGVAEGVKKTVAGVGALLELFGSNARAVAPAVSEKRAGICVTCPQNQKADWKSMFTKPVFDLIQLQLGIKSDLNLKTSHDSKLETCAACSCPLKLKVHVGLEFIRSNTGEETIKALDGRCWILKGDQ